MSSNTGSISACFLLFWLGAVGAVETPLLKGVVLNLHSGLSPAGIAQSLDSIRRLGAKDVLFRFCEYQEHARSATIGPDPTRTVAFETLAAATDLAQARRLRVSYMPVVLLAKPRTAAEWRGNLRPADRGAWQSHYSRMLRKYLRLAAAKRVAYFSVGSELSWAEYDVDYWLDLIRTARQMYSGALFYSFNWDHLSTTAAWRKLDVLGVTGYFQLAEKGVEPDRAALDRHWLGVHRQVSAWAAAMRKRALYTEIGYPSRVDALFDPWDHDRVDGAYDPAAQKLAHRAFIRSLRDAEVAGAFLYEWVQDVPPRDIGYSPKGKPAYRVWRSWFAAPARHQKAPSDSSSVKSGSPKEKSGARAKKVRRAATHRP